MSDDYSETVQDESVLARVSAVLRTVPAHPLQDVFNDAGGQPVRGSAFANELRDDAGGPDRIGEASAFALLWLLDACPQLFDALDSVLSAASARRHGPRPLIRAAIEHVARAAWLMDPSIGPQARGARAWLARAVSADEFVKAMEHGPNPQAQADSIARQGRVEQRIIELFGAGALEKSYSWNRWRIGGEVFGSMTAVVDLMSRRYFSPGTGRTFYMFQSALLHPSPASATVFSTRRDDGALTFPDFDRDFIVQSTVSILAAWHSAVEETTMYHGKRCAELEQWWAAAQELLGVSGGSSP